METHEMTDGQIFDAVANGDLHPETAVKAMRANQQWRFWMRIQRALFFVVCASLVLLAVVYAAAGVVALHSGWCR